MQSVTSAIQMHSVSLHYSHTAPPAYGYTTPLANQHCSPHHRPPVDDVGLQLESPQQTALQRLRNGEADSE